MPTAECSEMVKMSELYISDDGDLFGDYKPNKRSKKKRSTSDHDVIYDFLKKNYQGIVDSESQLQEKRPVMYYSISDITDFLIESGVSSDAIARMELPFLTIKRDYIGTRTLEFNLQNVHLKKVLEYCNRNNTAKTD